MRGAKRSVRLLSTLATLSVLRPWPSLAAAAAATSSVTYAIVNETCVKLATEGRESHAAGDLKAVFSRPWMATAWLEDTGNEGGGGDLGNQTFGVGYLTWKISKDNLHVTRKHLFVDQGNTVHEVGKSEDVSQVIQAAADHSSSSGSVSTAAAYVGEDGEEYLTVNTSNSATSCTVRLSHVGGHGNVISTKDKVFGFMGFSGDGQLLAYTAERSAASVSPLLRGLATRLTARDPVIVLYDVEKQTFSLVDIPNVFKPGFLQWHPHRPWLVGTVWLLEPLADLFPESGTSANHLFVYSDKDKSFSVLNDNDGAMKHYESPRFSPDGTKMVYLERDLSSVSRRRSLVPGPHGLSMRLLCVPWTEVVEGANDGLSLQYKASHVAIPNGQDDLEPVALPSGETFYGIYPYKDMWAASPPERIFSADGEMIFLSVVHLSDVRLLGVHLASGRIDLHEERGLVLMDVHDNLVLVRKDLSGRHPVLAVGRLHPDYWVTTTTTTTTTTTSTTTTTTVTPDRNTTLDPCDHLLQELETEGIVNTTVVDLSNQTTTTTETPTGNTTTTSLPTTDPPLSMAALVFSPLTEPKSMSYETDAMLFSRPKPSGWDWERQLVQSTIPFSAWLALPKIPEHKKGYFIINIFIILY